MTKKTTVRLFKGACYALTALLIYVAIVIVTMTTDDRVMIQSTQADVFGWEPWDGTVSLKSISVRTHTYWVSVNGGELQEVTLKPLETRKVADAMPGDDIVIYERIPALANVRLPVAEVKAPDRFKPPDEQPEDEDG